MRRIESQRDQFPFRVAAHSCHPDLAESHRTHGTVHTSGGRILPGWKLAMADTATQQSRLADPLGWSHHVAVQPSGLAVAGAQAYASLKGLSDPHDTDYTHTMQTPERVARVGRHYDAMPLHDPAALPHYHAMLKEVGDQYDFLTNRLGIKVQPVDHDPYAHVGEMMADVNNNKTLKVLGTHVTGGHPVFGNEGNDQFRAVHDFFGHAATGRDFDRHGEHATYLAHAKMFTPQAFPALTNETLGQNSSLILNGHFGPQKIGMIPREITAHRTAMPTTPPEYKSDEWYDDDYEAWYDDVDKGFNEPIKQLTDRLHKEFTNWATPLVEKTEWPHGGKWKPEPADLVGEWPYVERFLKDKYPAVHRGFDMGREEALSLATDTVDKNYQNKHHIQEYPTGPAAIAQYGYDPKEIAAGMLMLHTPAGTKHVTPTKDVLNDIFQKRQQMQRTYDLRTASRTATRLAVKYPDMHSLAQAGYNTDEWKRWQGGGCLEYAHALLQKFPHLSAGALYHDDGEFWNYQHHFAHDDTHAYDSAGKHPLPYHGVEGDMKMLLNDDLSSYDEPDPDEMAAAHQHIERHRIGPRTAARLAWRDDEEDEDDEILEGYPQEVHPLSMSTPMYPDFKSRHTIFDSELNRDVQHFSPHEINPASDGLARPYLEWQRGNHPEHPTLDLNVPGGTGGQSGSGYQMNLPTDRHPVTLYRGVSLSLDHPDLHRVRRMLHGDRYEYGDPGLVTPLRSPGGFSYYDGVQEYFLDPDLHDQALTRRSGWQWGEPPHPDLHRVILDHINKEYGGLGTHWTDDHSKAAEFAGSTSNGVNLPVILTQKWMGTGEDPYRRGTDGEWTDEREITKLRGAPVNLSQIEIRHSPEFDTSPRWRTIYNGEGLRHQAMRLTADSSGRPSNAYSKPEGLDTPRWSAEDRPLNPDGTYHFSPSEINPRPDTYARPSLTTHFDYPHEDSPLPFGSDAGVEWNDYFDQHEAVERQPTELHRGFKLSLTDTTSPPLAQIRRMIHGSEHEDDTDLWWNDHGGPEGQGGYDFTLPGLSSNKELTKSNPQGIAHPDVPHLIMDHLLNFNDQGPPTHPLDESKHGTELGRHWATSLDSARKFSGVYPWTTHHPQHRLSVVLSGHWKGQGEDPYRRYTEGDFDDEHEITLLPGAPMDIHSIHVFDPRNMFWHTHHMGGARHHAGKNVAPGPKRVRP